MFRFTDDPRALGTGVRYLNQQPLGEWSRRGGFHSDVDCCSGSKLGVLSGTQWRWAGLCPVATDHTYGLEANFGGEFKGLCDGNGHHWYPMPVPRSLSLWEIMTITSPTKRNLNSYSLALVLKEDPDQTLSSHGLRLPQEPMFLQHWALVWRQL